MGIDQRIRMAIGDLVVQLQLALAQVEELQAEVENLKAQIAAEEARNDRGPLREVK